MKTTFLLIVILQLFIGTTQAQLSVQSGLTAQQLANRLAGPDITVFNVNAFDSLQIQTGSFSYLGNDLGFNEGIILSTGNVMDAVGPNSLPHTTTSLSITRVYRDSILEAISSTHLMDLTYLEFEFEVPGDEISFNFIFLSEEYLEHVGNFNDAFAFVISGPGIVGEENLAVVPNTTIPITVNNVNDNSYWQYYVNNDSGLINIEYDGFTTGLTAKKTGLQPCGVYKLSLRIADGDDASHDSAVMLEANSLVSNSIKAMVTTYSTDTTALEGCIPARYTFDLGSPASQDLNIPIRFGGTALNGVDYEHIDSIITIPAGQSSSTIIINALSDALVEGRETIELYYRTSTSSCVPEDTAVLYIDDAQPLSYTATGTNLTCHNNQSGSINCAINGGTPPYSVQYTNTTTGITQQLPAIALPINSLNAGTYKLNVLDQYGCEAEAITAGGLFNAGQQFLPDGTGVSYTNDITITGFNTGQQLTSIQQINAICATLEHSYAGDLGIELIAPNGTSIELKGVGTTGTGVYTCNLGEPVASGPTDNWSNSNLTAGTGYQYCWTNNPTYPTMNSMIAPNAPGPPPMHTYTTLAGNSYTDYYLPAGSYTPRQSFYGLLGSPLNGNWQLKVTDYYPQDNGYLFDWSISLSAALPDSLVTLEEPDTPSVAHSITPATCGAADGAINLVVGGTAAPFSFVWNTGDTTKDLTGLAAGIYSVTIHDNNQCDFIYRVRLPNVGMPSPTATIQAETCPGARDGRIDLNMGTGTFSYTWSSGLPSSPNVSGLAPRIYALTIEDANNCYGYGIYEIEAAQPLILTQSIIDENCGDREGEIHLSIQGGQPPYQYNWSNGASTQQISDLPQGSYQVTISDANACTTSDTFTVLNLVGNCVLNCDLAITNAQIIDEACSDGSGQIELMTTTTGGTIFYTWSNGAHTEDLINLSMGTYSLTMEDTRGCKEVVSYTINNQTKGLTFPSIQVTNELCGNHQGRLDPIVYGGVLPYSFNWSNGSTNAQLSNLAAGTYTCTVTDANGCWVTLDTSLINQPDFEISYDNVVDADCGDTTGSIDIDCSPFHLYTYEWSNGATTEDLRAVPMGSYTCTITNPSSGCTLATSNYIIQNNSGDFQFNYIDRDPDVCNTGQGEIDIALSGGTQPYSYLWTTGDTTPNIKNLLAGIYGVTVIDSNGCTIHSGDLNIGNTSGILNVDQLIVLDEYCGNGKGSIQLQITGHKGPLSFLWNTGSNAQNLTNLSAGTYTCTVTDTIGCALYVTAEVRNNSGGLSILNTIIGHENCGQGDGSLSVITTGGLPPYSYQWSNGATIQNPTNLTSGIYYLTLTDVQGCQVIETAEIYNQTGTLRANLVSIHNEYCNDNGGSIDVFVQGGLMPYTYQWSNGVTTKNLSGLSSGVYTCTISDANACNLVLGSYNVANTSSLIEGNHHIQKESCNQQNGSIDLVISGGIMPYTYQWSNGATTEDLMNLSTGSYTCTINDAMGCILVSTQNVGHDAGTLEITQVSLNDEVCSNHQGSIDLIISGGTIPYTYQWSNGSTVQNMTNLSAGVYELTLSDANNCSLIANYTLNNTSSTFQLLPPIITNEECHNQQGSIELTLVNGQAPYSYQWSNGMTTRDISGLSEGLYSQTLTDANGCRIEHTTYVPNTAGDLAVNNSIIVDESCNNQNGWIDISVRGGTTPYSYQWSNGATTEDLSNLSGGRYTCLITDSTGCRLHYTIPIENKGGDLQITNLATVDNNCQYGDGAIVANVIGGNMPYTYTWGTNVGNQCGYYTLKMYSSLPSGGWPSTKLNISINGTPHGIYGIPYDSYAPNDSVRVAQIWVCEGDYVQLNFMGNPQIIELLDGTGNLVFANRSTGMFAISGYSFTVNSFFQGQGTHFLTGLNQGTYTLTVSDTNGCSVTRTADIYTTSGPLALAPVLEHDSCGQGEGAIDLELYGAVDPTYTWNNGQTTEDLAGLRAGIYSLTVSDVSGCFAVHNYTILNQTNGLEISDTTIIMDSCLQHQGSIYLSISGGQAPYSFEWDHGAVTKDVLGLSTREYIVTVTDFSGCSHTEKYYVENNTTGMYASSVVVYKTCTNLGSIDLNISGGAPPYSYQWSNGATTEDIGGLLEGRYSCSVTDYSGCTYVWKDTIKEIPSSLQISNVTIYKKRCNGVPGGLGGSIHLAVQGGKQPYTYLWSNGYPIKDLTNVSNGAYSITITDDDGCILMDTFELGTSPPLYITDTLILPEMCNNGQGAIDLTIPGTTRYLWSTGATTQDINNLSAGIYMLTVTQHTTLSGPAYCSHAVSFSVPASTGNFSLDTLTYHHENCGQGNGSIDILVSGGSTPYSYLWSNGQTTEDLNNIPAGFYQVTITDATGCSVSSTNIELKNITYGLGIAATFLTDEHCGWDAAINIVPSGGQAPYHYQWSNGDTTQDLSNISSGLYYLTLTDVLGCQLIDSFVVNSGSNALNIQPQIMHATCGLSDGAIALQVSGGIAPYTYQWFDGSTASSIAGLAAGVYPVTITDMNNCVVHIPISVADSHHVQLLAVDTTSSSCPSCTDGAIDLSLDPTAAPYNFIWSTGETTEDLNNISAGTYQVTITNTHRCTLDTVFMVSTSVGVQYVKSLLEANVYPNPSDGKLILEFSQLLDEAIDISIYNNLGQVIYTKHLDVTSLSAVIPIHLGSAVPSGVYLLQVSNTKAYFTEKIIIE